jgi:hypothetical protein
MDAASLNEVARELSRSDDSKQPQDQDQDQKSAKTDIHDTLLNLLLC